MGTGTKESELLLVAKELVAKLGIGSVKGLKIPRRFTGVKAEHLQGLLDSGNIAEALVIAARDTSPAKHLESGMKQFERKIKQAGRGNLEPKRATPDVLQLGTATHRIIESGILNQHCLDESLGRDVVLVSSDDPTIIKAIRFSTGSSLQLNPQLSLLEESAQTPLPTPQAREIKLPISLPKPDSGETIANWGFRTIAETLRELFQVNGGVPVTPEELNGYLRDSKKLEPIVKIVEVCHILWGDRSGISLIRNNEIKVENDDVFRVLNWLSIAREFSEIYRLEKIRFDEEPIILGATDKILKRAISIAGTNVLNDFVTAFMKEASLEPPGVINGLTEIPIGATSFGTADENQEINGGACDLVMVTMPDLNGVPFAQVHETIQGEFRRQSSRHRRKDRTSNVDRETKTTLYRNIHSYFWEIRRKYGPEAFSQISLTIRDIKAFGGDGGWHTGVNAEELFDPKHQRQVEEYLFLVIAQACRVNKAYGLKTEMGQIQIENVSVTVNEVVDFGIATGMFDRVRGFLDYYLPDQTAIIPILLPTDREALLKWANKFIDDRISTIKDNYTRYLLLKAWVGLLPDTINGEEPRKMKKEPPLPFTLKLICGEVLEKRYFAIEDLWDALSKEGGELLQISSAIYYKEDGVYVLYIAGLSKSGEPIRIAYETKSGNVNIFMDGKVIKASIRTIRNKFGLRQQPNTAQEYFEKRLWKNLNDLGVVPTELPSSRSEYYFYGLDGKPQKTVPGKFIICYYDPMTGRLMIDAELARVANDKMGALATDTFGLRGILEVLHTRPRHTVIVRCIDPRHDDGTPSCQWIPWSLEDPTPDHFFCYLDRVFIYPSTKFEDQVSVAVAPATEVQNYRPVSPSRQKTVEMVYQIATICGARDDTAHRYISGRGLDPQTDIGHAGFIPPKFSHALAEVVVRNKDDEPGKAFWQFLKDKKMLRQNISVLLANLDHEIENQLPEKVALLAEYKHRLEAVESSLVFLSPDHKEFILDMLTLERIEELQRRGLVGKSKEGLVRFGGRVEQILYWFNENGILVPSNFNSREIPNLAEGDRFLNMFVRSKRSKPKLNKDGELLNRTPKGIWMRDPEKCVTEITLSGEVVVTEGWINAASLGRFNPEYKNKILAMCGSGTGTLAAILKKLNVRVLYLATDFDHAGSEALKRAATRIKGILPEIKIRDVRELLPDQIQKLIPTVTQLEALEATPETKNPTIAPWGKDLNDLLKTPEGQKYAHRSN